jgi:hypothetical protein
MNSNYSKSTKDNQEVILDLRYVHDFRIQKKCLKYFGAALPSIIAQNHHY